VEKNPNVVAFEFEDNTMAYLLLCLLEGGTIMMDVQ
jgi:hypothetical protein